VETKCFTPESPLPQPFSTPVAGTSKEPTVTQISPSKSQPSSSVQPTTKRNWVNLSDRVMLSFKEKNDIQNDKKICCNIIDFAQQLLKVWSWNNGNVPITRSWLFSSSPFIRAFPCIFSQLC
jgi:hypothetical protein